MKKSGAQAVRKVLGQYVHQLKSGVQIATGTTNQ